MKKKPEKIIQKVTEKILSLLDVEATVSVEIKDEHAAVTLDTEDSGVLIGYHGETLESLQLIIALCAAKELGEFTRVSLEIGDYKKNREDRIRELVEEAKEQVVEKSQSVTLPDLKAWERRFVHMLLAEDSEVKSVSSGEGRDRILEIQPK